MSQNKSINFLKRTALAIIFTSAAILSGVTSAFISIALVNAQNPFASITANLPFLLLSVLLTVLSAMTAGRMMLFVSLVPSLFAIPYIPQDIPSTVAVVFSAVSVLVLSNLLYQMYRKGANGSSICPAFSFAAVICEIIRSIVPIAVIASQTGRKFSTVLFDGLGSVIDDSVSYISYMFDAAAKISPELEQSLTGAEINILRTSMSMSVAMMPAIIACVFFFAAFLVVGILDFYNRKSNIFPERKTEIYTVTRPCYIVFNILTVVYILNFFFGSGLGRFYIGLTSAIIFMFPHFAILATRKLCTSFRKVCGKFLSVILIFAIIAIGFIFSVQLLFWIFIFIGTSEYRNQEFQKRNLMR